MHFSVCPELLQAANLSDMYSELRSLLAIFVTLYAARFDLAIGVKPSTNNNRDLMSGHLHPRAQL